MAVNEQTQKDTERAKGRLAPNRATPRNEQTQKDTDKASAQTDKDSAPSSSTMDQREAAAGLNLAGNDTMSGRRGGISIPTMDQRESAAGLTGTTAGREDSFYSYQSRPSNPWQSADSEAFAPISPMEFKDDEVATEPESYSFKVIDDGDGSVSVLAGAVNTSDATGLEPAGKPTDLWLKATVSSDEVTAAAVVTSNPGADSTTQTSRQLATITWDGNTPTIAQGLRGSQSVSSCGSSHEWTSLYA